MDIYLSVNNRAEVFMLPVVPASFTISKPQTANTFETVSKGELLLIGEPKLKSITLSSFFPIQGHNYSFLRNRTMWGWDYVNKIDDWIEQKLPIRLTITDTPINMAVAVKDFEYEIRSDGDLWYTLELNEFNLLENIGSAAAETEEELTVSQYEELKQDLTNLTAIVSDLAHPMIYNCIDDNMPSWAHEAVQAAADAGILSGSGDGWGLTYNDLKTIVWMHRAGLFN